MALTVRFAFMGFLLYTFLRLRKSSPSLIAAGMAANQFRSIRIVHRIMLVGVVLYAFTAERLAMPPSRLSLPMALGLGIVAIVVAAIAFGYRMKLLPSAIEALRRNPQDVQALYRWRQAHIVTMVLLVSVALFGFVLRFMGGSFWVALPFYFASISLLLLWAPNEAEGTIENTPSSSIGN